MHRRAIRADAHHPLRAGVRAEAHTGGDRLPEQAQAGMPKHVAEPVEHGEAAVDPGHRPQVAAPQHAGAVPVGRLGQRLRERQVRAEQRFHQAVHRAERMLRLPAFAAMARRRGAGDVQRRLGPLVVGLQLVVGERAQWSSMTPYAEAMRRSTGCRPRGVPGPVQSDAPPTA